MAKGVASTMPPSPPATPGFPRHSTHGSRRSRGSSTDVRLSIIVEDGSLPPLPQKAYHRPFSQRWNIGDPPSHSFEKPPPKYDSVWDVTGPKGEKLGDVRNNKHIASRGGWRRICVVALLIMAVLVALSVGLAVGMHKTHKVNQTSANASSTSSTPSSPMAPSTTGSFPAGSYTFTTFLDNATTDCTSVPTDWQCPPYHLYRESPSRSAASFQWIITPSGSPSTPNFTISSSANPFNLDFVNASLALLDPHTDSERYTFTTRFNKVVIPSLGIHCFFNNTILEGTLYTRRPKSTSVGSAATGVSSAAEPAATENVASDAFAEWRHAVDTTHSIGGGTTIPECYHMNDGVKGAKLLDGVTPQAVTEKCSCVYKNYDL